MHSMIGEASRGDKTHVKAAIMQGEGGDPPSRWFSVSFGRGARSRGRPERCWGRGFPLLPSTVPWDFRPYDLSGAHNSAIASPWASTHDSAASKRFTRTRRALSRASLLPEVEGCTAEASWKVRDLASFGSGYLCWSLSPLPAASPDIAPDLELLIDLALRNCVCVAGMGCRELRQIAKSYFHNAVHN